MTVFERILIVDDEKLARQRVRRFLTKLTTDANIEEAHNGLEAKDIIESFKPDLVFLDIQMPGLTGFELLQQLSSRNFVLIFQTAFDDFAIRAFEESACDYLPKPFGEDRFEKAFLKATKIKSQERQLAALESKVRKESGCLTKLAIRKNGKTQIVHLSDVEFFWSQDHYTCLYSKGHEFITEFSLAWLEERLNPEAFVRCHRNNIVALNQIAQVNATTILLRNGMTADLSRSHRRRLLKIVGA